MMTNEPDHLAEGDYDPTALPECAYRDIAQEDVAWFERTVQRVVDVIADRDDDTGAPEGAAICFMDLDDVTCLSDPYGGFDALDAVRGKRIDAEAVFEALLHAPAVQVLREAHEALGGQVRYVISSTWRRHFNRSELAEVLRRAGLPFVAAHMERRLRWATPDYAGHGSRLDEIAAWLEEHGQGEPFVIIDDTFSGRSLVRPATDVTHPFFGRIVVCQEEVGLLPHHADIIVKALRTPVATREAR